MQRNILITGTDQGLGKILVKTFLVRGYQVFAGSFKESSRYGDSRHIGGENLEVLPLDVSSAASVETALRTIKQRTDSLDIVINNAGINHANHNRPLEEIDIEEIPEIFQVNSLGPLRIVGAFLPLLRNGQSKLIINISSEDVRVEDCDHKDRIGYYMSKTALNIQSRILQNQLAEDGIKVLAINPGWMQTAMGGTGAQVPPVESARGIYDLSQETWGMDDPVFMEYTGRQAD
ncbi:MAG: SDR family NAD(P)-dependent oxidoreductase [Spirochaetales bacterium]|jgi:NAD(P)-dependent dehydrogenase (short-subunit alcohol dehydrogenase family)|nr:SDR family NAD(P)-dependent oxidoreductase [Spirochaetales bacterium]